VSVDRRHTRSKSCARVTTFPFASVRHKSNPYSRAVSRSARPLIEAERSARLTTIGPKRTLE
jgi:hypothetical protein